MIVRCKTQNCGATGEGDTLEEAIANADHSISLSKSGACPGGVHVNYELVKRSINGGLEFVKEIAKPVCTACGSLLPHGTKLDSSKDAKEPKTIPKAKKSDDKTTDQPTG